MIAYMITSIGLLIASVLVFFNHLSVGVVSLLPAILALISLLQGFIFYGEAKEKETHESTAYTSKELDNKAYLRAIRLHCLSKLAVVPLLLALALFFGTGVKIGCSIAIYILSYLIVKPLSLLRSEKE